jgi:N-acetylneuraminic acid mutarotase
LRKSVALLLVLVFLTASNTVIAKPAASDEMKENTWTTRAPMPQAIRGVKAAVVNGKIYVIGGEANFEYDPDTDTWIVKKPMPTARTYFEVAVHQNKIYTIGGRSGWTSTTGSIYSGANEVYDPSTDTWETKKLMPTNRSDISASVVNGKIHLIGPDIHEVYDVYTDSWTTRQTMSFPLLVYGYSSVVFNDKIYLITWNQTQIYDPKSDSWSLGASPPINVSGSGVCATTGIMAPKKIYVIGGGLGLEGTDATQVYDPKNDTWTLGAPMPTARLGLTVAVVNDQIYAIGGSGLAVFSPSLKTIEQYTPFGYGTPDPSYDGTPPEITLISPENKTYHKTSIPLEFSVNEPVSWMRYNLDNENITEISGNTTITGLSFGSHNLTVYATDDAGNTGVCQTIHFKVAEEPFPTTLIIAAVVTVAVIGIGLLVYFKKRKR